MRRNLDRRQLLGKGLQGAAGLASLPALSLFAGRAAAQSAASVSTQQLTSRVSLISNVPGNVVALTGDSGITLVDSGSAAMASAVQQAIEGDVVRLINTHYHPDQAGGNALFGESGATIHAHEITRQWLSTDYYVPSEDRWVEAPPEAARPTETFRLKDEMTVDSESIELGYLLEAHTRGDIYAYFRDSNVLAAGDVVSPVRDPIHDWYAGGWLGGRVDALDDLLEIANNDTQIVPAYGPVMTRSELQIERDMMWHLFDRTAELVNNGRDAEDMLEAGVLDEVDREFSDPYRFMYDVAKGHWAHYLNFGGNVV